MKDPAAPVEPTPPREIDSRPAWFALVLLLLGHGVFSFALFPMLPDEIPLHFDAAGVTDRVGPADFSSWFSIFLISLGCAVFIGLTAAAIPKIPSKYLSMPKKEKFLALPPDAQRRHLKRVSFHTLVLSITMCAAFLALHVSVALMAFGILATFPSWLVIAVLAVTIAEVVIMIIALGRSVDDEIASCSNNPRGDGGAEERREHQ